MRIFIYRTAATVPDEAAGELSKWKHELGGGGAASGWVSEMVDDSSHDGGRYVVNGKERGRGRPQAE